jgi:hypothetical protein
MKLLHQVLFVVSIVIVLITWYFLFLSRTETFLTLIDSENIYGNILFALYGLSTIFYFYTIIFIIVDIFKSKKKFTTGMIWFLGCIFLPLIVNYFYFHKYIFPLYFDRK